VSSSLFFCICGHVNAGCMFTTWMSCCSARCRTMIRTHLFGLCSWST
jgi:hypothetical protein